MSIRRHVHVWILLLYKFLIFILSSKLSVLPEQNKAPILSEVRDLSVLPSFQTGSGLHPTSCFNRYLRSFLGIKRPTREADQSHLMSRLGRKGGTTKLPHMPSWACRQLFLYICINNVKHMLLVCSCWHWTYCLPNPSRCVSIQLVYIFTSYTTINIIIHTIKCYNVNGYMFRSPLRPSSGQLLQIVGLQCAYNMGSHKVYIIFIYGLKSLLTVILVHI